MYILRRLLCVSIALFLFASSAAGVDKQLVSGNLKKLNNFAKVAVCPNDGSALIVWSQGNAKDNSYGRIYACEARRQPDGLYAIQPFFLVGIGQRPTVVYLLGAGKYFIAWDTSLYDLNEYRGYYLEDQREKFPGGVIRARTYSPGPANPADGLGAVVELSDPVYELNLIANAVDVPDSDATGAATSADRVFVSWLGSDESEHDNYEVFDAGIFGSTWDVVAAAAPSANDITSVDRLQMLSWDSDPYNMGALTCGFYRGGNVYAAGACIDFTTWEIACNFVRILARMHVYYSGSAMIYRIDPETLTVEDYFKLGSHYYGDKDTPLSTGGNIVPLAAAAAPGVSFPIIGCNNVQFEIASLESDFDPQSYTKLGYIYKKKTQLVDQRVVAAGGNLCVIYHNKKGQFRRRMLSAADGSPKGGAKTILTIKKRRLQWMDAASYGKDVLLVFSEARNKKKYRIHLAKFTP